MKTRAVKTGAVKSAGRTLRHLRARVTRTEAATLLERAERWAKHHWRSALLATSGLALLAVSLPARAQASGEGFFGQILESLSDATQGWAAFLLNGSASSPGVAFQIFYVCLILQVIYLGFQTALRAMGRETMPLLQVAARQLPILILLYATLFLWPEWGVAPQRLFFDLGREMTGYEEGLEPDVLAAAAMGLGQVFSSPKLFLFNAPLWPNPFFLIYIVFVMTAVLALMAIAVRALLLTVEGHLLASIGPVPFAFSGFYVTAGLADNYLRWGLKFGVEYWLTMLFVKLGADFAATWAAELEGISAFDQPQVFVFVIRNTVMMVAWALLAIRLPGKAANELVHLWTPGIREGLRA